MKSKKVYLDQMINGVSWERTQRIREKQYGIKRGESLELSVTERDDDGKRTVNSTKRMILREFYKHHVLLESPSGIRECMGYWMLHKCKCGGENIGKVTS